MKKVHSADNAVDVGLLTAILEDNGISCLVKNQNLGGAMGEIPPLECWPEIWVTHDADYQRALDIVEESLKTPAGKAEDWHCICGELIESQFTACWSCGCEQISC